MESIIKQLDKIKDELSRYQDPNTDKLQQTLLLLDKSISRQVLDTLNYKTLAAIYKAVTESSSKYDSENMKCVILEQDTKYKHLPRAVIMKIAGLEDDDTTTIWQMIQEIESSSERKPCIGKLPEPPVCNYTLDDISYLLFVVCGLLKDQ